MRILLLGKTGLLGQALFDALKKGHEVFACSHAECDVTILDFIKKTVKKSQPEIVINSTGYTNVDKAEEEKAKAFLINEKAVVNIIDAIKPMHIPLLHFSTDYVFDGENENGYAEDSRTNPISTYGASKAAGEKIIAENLKNYYLIRTSWLYGPGGKNFVDTMLRLAETHETLKVVSDQKGSPTYTPDLAKAIARLLNEKPPYGIYHLTNDGVCTWHEFACEIFNQLGVPKRIVPITSEELARPAKRPKCSILINAKFAKMRHWKEALQDFLINKTLIL